MRRESIADGKPVAGGAGSIQKNLNTIHIDFEEGFTKALILNVNRSKI